MRGNSPYDGASAYDNVRDTCWGRKAKRSSYGTAPGGCVCLNGKMLKHMYDYGMQFWNKYRKPMAVTSIAGSSHSYGSRHYKGATFDIACRDLLIIARSWKIFAGLEAQPSIATLEVRVLIMILG